MEKNGKGAERMRISKSSAQQIVEEIGKLVHQNINLMDETGTIVASNDHSRIGSFHRGAYRIIQEHLPELYITPELAQSTPLVRQGINLPIEVDGQVEGVVGITGAYEEVFQYGQIVKKMAEILVRERMSLDAHRLDLRVHSRFLEDWVLSDGLENPQALSQRGFALGIDIRAPRRCMVVSIRNRTDYTNTLEGQQLIEDVEQQVERLLEGRGLLFLRNAARQILLLPQQSTKALEALARRLVENIRAVFSLHLVVGIDGQAGDVHSAYLQANRAWRVANHSREQVLCYETLSTELILDDISSQAKQQYLGKIFAGCPTGKVREYIPMLEAWFDAEGSLSSAADSLFIHRNTLQYRIKSLAQETGLDVRKCSQAPALYLATLFYRDLENDGGFVGYV